jgi:hypothetical protein
MTEKPAEAVSSDNDPTCNETVSTITSNSKKADKIISSDAYIPSPVSLRRLSASSSSNVPAAIGSICWLNMVPNKANGPALEGESIENKALHAAGNNHLRRRG